MYSITLIVFALGLPIVLTWAMRWLPFVETLSDKVGRRMAQQS